MSVVHRSSERDTEAYLNIFPYAAFCFFIASEICFFAVRISVMKGQESDNQVNPSLVLYYK